MFFKRGDYPDSPIASLGLDELSATVDGSLFCSFCGLKVSKFEATIGSKLAKIVTPDIPIDNEILTERTVHFSKQLVACKDHSLLIRGGIKFELESNGG